MKPSKLLKTTSLILVPTCSVVTVVACSTSEQVSTSVDSQTDAETLSVKDLFYEENDYAKQVYDALNWNKYTSWYDQIDPYLDFENLTNEELLNLISVVKADFEDEFRYLSEAEMQSFAFLWDPANVSVEHVDIDYDIYDEISRMECDMYFWFPEVAEKDSSLSDDYYFRIDFESCYFD